ncbi:hypothetical protein MHBO_000281 [Bonamia ostreae]|uniref:PARP-type domain-containing protein n=1 Tax=Bonamia ostreae TaxID=126728 RepID=A0ABV2AFQ6_9EUKA
MDFGLITIALFLAFYYYVLCKMMRKPKTARISESPNDPKEENSLFDSDLCEEKGFKCCICKNKITTLADKEKTKDRIGNKPVAIHGKMYHSYCFEDNFTVIARRTEQTPNATENDFDEPNLYENGCAKVEQKNAPKNKERSSNKKRFVKIVSSNFSQIEKNGPLFKSRAATIDLTAKKDRRKPKPQSTENLNENFRLKKIELERRRMNLRKKFKAENEFDN